MRPSHADASSPRAPLPALYACLYEPPSPDHAAAGTEALLQVAEEFSPRYERHGDRVVSIDVRGLDRLLGTPRVIGEELRREAADRGLRVHVALAATRTTALVIALARPGVTIVGPGHEAAALRSIPVGLLEKIHTSDGEMQSFLDQPHSAPTPSRSRGALRQAQGTADLAIAAFKHWGVRTLGEIAALPAADLAARLGQQGLRWQAIARGEDLRPLIPTLPEERFDASLELEWPIEGLEPLSFVLTRLLEPLSTRLERRDRGAAGLHVVLRLVTRRSTIARRGDPVEPRDEHARYLQLPSPLRDVRALRTLALLDLESHPPPAAIDRVTVTIDPTPGRVLQHTLFTRPHPTPDQISTLLARLAALMGQDRLGTPAPVDSYRPDAFAMAPFATEHDTTLKRARRPARGALSLPKDTPRPARGVRPGDTAASSVVHRDRSAAPSPESSIPVVSALRRCRPPIPARVGVGPDHRPLRVTTDRRGVAGGGVVSCAGPWRTSGEWWVSADHPPGRPDRPDQPWSRDEWDVALSDGAVYRIFRDRATDGWFIDAIVD
jgi:protein ImuB